jgi:hypothetical protein
MCRECTTNGEKMNACGVFVRKLDGKRLLGRPRHRWEDNIKKNLEKQDDVADWINLVQDKAQCRLLSINEPSG